MMREGRWRNVVDPAAAAGRWPGADRRRRGGDVEQGAAVIDRQPREVSMASQPATPYTLDDLTDPRDHALFLALMARFEIDQRAVAFPFYVGRTRRGHVLVVTTWDVDDAGEPVLVLGAPVARVHVQPVGLDELPTVCRSGR